MAVSAGFELVFFAEAGSGSVQLRPDGSLILGAETECPGQSRPLMAATRLRAGLLLVAEPSAMDPHPM